MSSEAIKIAIRSKMSIDIRAIEVSDFKYEVKIKTLP